MDQKAKKKKKDHLRNLKWMGYRLSQLPDSYALKDLVRFAKFQLAVMSHRLLKDPIWDEYTVEELLVEFYAHQFMNNKDFRLRFEQEMRMNDDVVDDFAAWADAQMAKEAKIIGGVEDSVKFNPQDVMGADE